MDNNMYSLRILAKGKITDLSKGFSLKDGKPFSIFLYPKKATIETCTVISCKLLCDKAAGDFPVPIGDWTPGAIASISPNAISLADYDVFWGAGETI